MPYLEIPEISEQKRVELAAQRWAAILAVRPDLAPALDLQRRLLSLVSTLTVAFETGRLPRLSMPPKYLAAKLTRGVPIFSGEPIPVPSAVIKPTLLQLCDALAAGGAGDAAAHIRAAIDDGSIEIGSLLTASLTRNQPAIRTGATHRGLAPDLVWLIAELAVGPFVHVLQRALFTAPREELRAALEAWNHGYCPACGSWPAVAEVAGGHRALRCSFCSSGWEMRTYACIYCGEDGDAFVTAAPDDERKDRRVEVCSACGGYLKTIDMPELSPYPLLSISDIETTDLDVAAMEQGYQRPPLKDFTKRA
jgi:FdhE protein